MVEFLEAVHLVSYWRQLMDANKMRIEDFLGQNRTRFMIPVYQRNYDWSTPQCGKLFSDILSIGRNEKENTYFIGSIVYIHDDVTRHHGSKNCPLSMGNNV
jgi:hypothetical protein